jgi:23S rRNA pseudouridine2605 synthase
MLMEKRLQKILAEMGIASRRKAEEYIAEGRVLVNGRVAVLGQKADPARDHIKLDGKLLTQKAEPKVYYALHKPRHVVTALEDPEDRPTVKAFLRKVRYRTPRGFSSLRMTANWPMGSCIPRRRYPRRTR